jgi:hypothetical protein
MIIEATPKNVEWLLGRLYEAYRELQNSGVQEPQFVLLTKGIEDRHRVEQVILTYLQTRYGSNILGANWNYVHSTATSTAFQLPPINAKILLMDI